MINDMDYIDLPDQRLNVRLGQIVEELSAAPSQSIPQACGEWYKTKATYRFLK